MPGHPVSTGSGGDSGLRILAQDYPATPGRAHAADLAVQRAFAAAVGDSGRLAGLLEALSRGRLWLPLADDARPVTDGGAVSLPTVRYLGAEFVPGYTSASALLRSARPGPAPRAAVLPHIVVPAAALARLLPPGVGIALNPGAAQSVPVYPAGVAYLAAPRVTSAAGQVSVGPPPAEPAGLLAALRFGLRQVRAARQAATAWLSAETGQGLVISVWLDEPADQAAQHAVLDVVERAACAAPDEPGYPIDVTFPGEGEPNLVDQWVTASADPFYCRV
jgi:hypothetical protein